MAGVPSILLKGPSFGSWLYGPREVRSYIDIDLLVPLDRLSDGQRVLKSLGFGDIMDGASEIERPTHATTWHRPSDATWVDLHRTVRGVRVSPPQLWDALVRESTTLMVGGRLVVVPSIPSRAVLVALHAIQHGTGDERCMEDLRRAVETQGLDVWQAAKSVASEIGATGSLSAGLRLLPRGQALAQALGLDSEGSAELRLRAADLPRRERSAALGLERLMANSSWSSRIKMVARQLFPTPDYLRYREPVARRGSFGLVVGYVWRPIHLGLGFLRGARRWSRVHGELAGIGLIGRAELVVWSGLARVLLPIVGLKKTLIAFDAIPRVPAMAMQGSPVPPRGRLIGTCLPRSVARSQYLRMRRREHEIVLGVGRDDHSVSAHAWLEPFDPDSSGFEVIYRVRR
jgi:hypothetical protein